MAALPATSKTYSVRANVPYQNNASGLALSQSMLWSLKEHMKNTLAGGTVGGTRDPNSVWTVKSSCDSVNVSLVGVDWWTVYTNLVWAASGTAHSWIVLENATLGYQVLIECVTAASTYVRIGATEIANPYTGGTTLLAPTSTYEFCCGTTATGPSGTFSFNADTATGNLNWTHYVTEDSGAFTFMASRTGLGMFSSYISLRRTSGNHPADTRNVVWLGNASISGRGAPLATTVGDSASGCTMRCPNGVINTTGGLRRPWIGGSSICGQGVDAVSGNYIAVACKPFSGAQFVYRGIVPDMYFTSGGTVGGSVPSAAAQERVIAGDCIVPFPTVNPTL